MKYTHCRECGTELTDENNTLAHDLCDPCELAVQAPGDILMPIGDEFEGLLEKASETRSEKDLAALGKYILVYLDMWS